MSSNVSQPVYNLITGPDPPGYGALSLLDVHVHACTCTCTCTCTAHADLVSPTWATSHVQYQNFPVSNLVLHFLDVLVYFLQWFSHRLLRLILRASLPQCRRTLLFKRGDARMVETINQRLVQPVGVIRAWWQTRIEACTCQWTELLW